MIGKLIKLINILLSFDGRWYRALFSGVAASTEHLHVFGNIDCRLVIDVGANRGQFALMIRHCLPSAAVVSFEPLPEPARVFRALFAGDSMVTFHDMAIGPVSERRTMHVSARDDSSSLLPIAARQSEIFPGTQEIGTIIVKTAPLEEFFKSESIKEPTLLKLDVQGFELEALQGCESLLPCMAWVYCECSFVELYSGQKLASDVIEWLNARGFSIEGVFNVSYDNQRRAVQTDILFRHRTTGR